MQSSFFIVVRNEEVKIQLAEAAVQQVWIESAPILIVVASDLKKAEDFYGDRGKDVYSRHNAAAATQNMLLVAHDIGLSSAWVGAFDEDMVSRSLGLPEHIRPEVIMTVGYPDEKVPIPPRFLDVLLSSGKTSHLVKHYVERGVKAADKLTNKFMK